MACLASGKSTLRMSGTCTARGMANILPDLTAAAQFTAQRTTAYSLPADRASTLLAPRPSRVVHASRSRSTRPLAARPKLHALFVDEALNVLTKLHTV